MIKLSNKCFASVKQLKIVSTLAIAGVLISMPVFAATTVTVDDNSRVTVDQGLPETVVLQTQPIVVVQEAKDPQELEGEITRVDLSNGEIVVRDADNREKRVLLKEGMISNYKVGDYVQIYLRNGLNEAKTIKTQPSADLEGQVVAVDTSRSVIVVRDERGKDNTVIVNSDMNGKNKVGDRVRLYVVSDSPNVQEVRLIRVR
jgi:ribosomal protein L21E